MPITYIFDLEPKPSALPPYEAGDFKKTSGMRAKKYAKMLTAQKIPFQHDIVMLSELRGEIQFAHCRLDKELVHVFTYEVHK